MRIKLDIPLSLDSIVHSCSLCTPPQIKNTLIKYITTDSRLAQPNDLFFAIRGEHFDGANFVDELLSKNVITVSPKIKAGNLYHSDPLSALMAVSRYYKKNVLKELSYTVAVTGSVGKTTVKDMVLTLLGDFVIAHGTKGNLNNFLGVSYTLLSAPHSCDVLVVELGMNHKGEIKRLSELVEPTLGIITNIGSSHIGNLGSRKDIASAKMELTYGMNDGAILCEYEEPLLSSLKKRITISLSDGNADCFLSNIRISKDGYIFDLTYKNERIENIRSHILGKHILKALGFAICAALEIGISTKEVKEGASKITESSLRRRTVKMSDFIILDDSYNSSEESVRADLEYMLCLKADCRSAVLGDILELGSQSLEIHERIGALAAEFRLDRLYLIGNMSKAIARGAMKGGMNKADIFINEDLLSPHITAKQILENHKSGELILFKASNKIRLERIIELLAKWEDENAGH